MIKVLYLTNSWIAGSEMSLLSLLKGLDRSRFCPIVMANGEGPLVRRLKSLEVEMVVMALPPLKPTNPLPYAKAVYRLTRLIKGYGIALVHSNLETLNQCGLVAARLCGVPVVCHLRNPYQRRGYCLDLVPFSDVLIANSIATANGYLSSFGGRRLRAGADLSKPIAVRPYVRKQKLFVIYNGIDMGEFAPQAGTGQEFRSQLGLDGKALVLGMIGWISPIKGQDVFIEAVARIAQAVPEVYGLVVGDAEIGQLWEYQESLKWRVAELGLSQRIIFTGVVEDIAKVYHSLDILVVPSRRECFGRVLLEALAVGKPVVASQVGGIPEVIEDGRTGILVPPEDPEALASAILRLLGDRTLARRLGESGRALVAEKFSLESHAAAMERVYAETLKGDTEVVA